MNRFFEEFYDNQSNDDWKISKEDFVEILSYCLPKIFDCGFQIYKDLYQDESDSVCIDLISLDDIRMKFYLWIDDKDPYIMISYMSSKIEPRIFDYNDYKKELECYLELYLNYKNTILNTSNKDI